jgi:hypothetical protein
MIKTLLICAVVSVSAVACSTTTPAKTASAATTSACVPESASRIPVRPGECASAPGQAYSDQEIERTGRPTVGAALQSLDPSITVHH